MRYEYIFVLLCSMSMSGCLLFRQAPEFRQTNPTVTDNTSTNPIPTLSTKPMSGEYKLLDNADSIQISLMLDIPRLVQNQTAINNLIQDFTFQYGILPTYTAQQYTETAVVSIIEKQILYYRNSFYVTFNIPKRATPTAVMILEIIDKKNGERVKLDFSLPYAVLKIREKIGVYNETGEIPYFSTYLQTRDTLQFHDVAKTSQQLYVRYYKQVFEAANPPMITNERIIVKNLKSDSLFKINTLQAVQFKKAGLYLLQTDTTQYYGISLYIVERKYPKLSYIKDVIEPLRYITTDDEFLQLRNGVNTKQEMDKLWLKLMSNDTKLAKKTIREFYNRVKLANRYFTTYKEGWKTDMGMVYMIYGRPSRIIRNNDMEFWFYNPSITNQTEIRFSFAKKPNQFVDENYSLVRQSVYENVWYPAIELWRTGKAF